MIESLLHQVNNSDTFSLTLRAKLLYITWTTGICFKIGFGEVSRVIALILYGLVNLSRNLKRNFFKYFSLFLSITFCLERPGNELFKTFTTILLPS